MDVFDGTFCMQTLYRWRKDQNQTCILLNTAKFVQKNEREFRELC